MTEERNKEAERVEAHCSSPPRVTSSKTLTEMEKVLLFIFGSKCVRGFVVFVRGESEDSVSGLKMPLKVLFSLHMCLIGQRPLRLFC